MKKFIIQIILLLLIIGAAIFLFKNNQLVTDFSKITERTGLQQLQVGNATIQVEIADTQSERSKGLSGRESLGSDEGMLFIFPQSGRYSFWMKGLKFPLDFVWIRGETVVDLTPDAQPPLPDQPDTALPIYQSKEDIDKVLEVNAGTIQRLDIKVGNTIKII